MLLVLLLAACGGAAPDPEQSVSEAPAPEPISIRIATWNVSMYDPEAGGLIRRLETGEAAFRSVASILQHMRPDVVLLNEFDYDAAERAAELFQRHYLEVPQHGMAPLRYEYRFSAPVNTGVPSGLDLDGDGHVDGPADAWGYGTHPGQYGMLLLSRYPIDAAAARSFQHLRWADLPSARRPMNPDGTHFYTDEVWDQLRLSSKSHWDVPVRTALGTIHVLASHPTPPVFDGPERRNLARNADEIELWLHYLSADSQPWLCDDRGRCGGLAAGQRFVVLGDLNADRHDGDGDHGVIARLLGHPRIQGGFTPVSDGAAAAAQAYGHARQGDVSAHTGNFGPHTGTLRIDYLLPSTGFQILRGGVFWPRGDEPGAEWAGASDHHMVWVDLADPEP